MQAEKEQDRWKVITLADTVDWMLSEDYKKRLKAEYWQIDMRIESLYRIIHGYNWQGKPLPEGCSIDLLLWQIDAMERYEKVLARRARAEKINLSPWDEKGNINA